MCLVGMPSGLTQLSTPVRERLSKQKSTRQNLIRTYLTKFNTLSLNAFLMEFLIAMSDLILSG